MNYKKIFRSAKLRMIILNMLSFIPDKLMIKMQYRIKTGRKLNLKKPIRYSEKLQWYKLYYRNENMRRCCDKYEVRKYVSEHGFEGILNDCYGVYDNVDDIDWKSLPSKFVLKDTLGGGGRSIIIVEDKDKLDIELANKIMKKWLNINYKKKNMGREWNYVGKKHRIIIERYLINDSTNDLPDYKFFCFNGQVFCSYMMENYTMHHDKGVLGFLDKDFNLLKAHRTDFAPMTKQPIKPINYEKMVEIAEVLSKEFPHVRVDFYNLNGKIIFGEMTFFNASGYVMFDPDSFDFEMGDKFLLPERNN